MKKGSLILVIVLGGILVYGSLDFPPWGDPGSPASTHVSPYYIEKSEADTAVPNFVTSILADYRGFDTMFETTVIFTAAIACIFLLRTFREEKTETRFYRHIPSGITLRVGKGGKIPDKSAVFERIDSEWVPHSVIIRAVCRLIVPFIQLFALYVIAHGHHSPGGGFQGGVILGASFILYAISFNLRATIRRISERLAAILSAVGVFIYAGTGALCAVLGGMFLDYSALAGLLGVDRVMARSHSILIVEIGVGIAVMAVMVTLYYILSSGGKYKEGL